MWLGSRAVRSVGVGELSLGVAAARGIDRAAVARALSAALSAGFDLVEAAAEDDTERLVGESIRELRLRDTVITATRVPAITAVVRDVLMERMPPRYVVARVEAALRATKLDALPLAQIELRAAWRRSSAWPELVGTCARLVREGKVLAWGALVDRIEEDTAELVRERWLDSINVAFSLCDRTADPVLAAAAASTAPAADDAATGGALATGLSPEHMRAAGLTPELAIAAGLPAELVLAAVAPTTAAAAKQPEPGREHPIAVLARRPLAGGALAGFLGPGVRLRPRDDRNALDAQTLEQIATRVAALASLVKQVPPAASSCEAAKSMFARTPRPPHVECETLAELALRYVVTRGALALPRLHRHEHVIDTLAASVLPPLPPDLVERIETV